MSNDVSVIPVIPVAQHDAGNRIMWAMGMDSNPLPGVSFTIALNTTEDWPPTHYALAVWATVDRATEFLNMPLNGGTLPTFTQTLEDAGLTQTQAEEFCASVDPWCRTGGSPMENFNAMCSARGLMRVFE